MKEQFQEEASYCGVYAVAFATDLAYDNPASREYEQIISYGHIILNACLKNRLFHSIKTNKAREAQIRVIHILHMSYAN